VINPAIWKSLSPDHRQVLDQAISASVGFQRNLWTEREAENLASIEAAGVTVIRPDQQAFINAVQPLWTTYEDSAIGILAKRIQAVQ
jgi:TRAP-type C4-dicarboxylate transport system substrate-binding protein